MSGKKKHIIWLVIGVIIFAAGWSVRSTFIMQGYVNKPIGGVLIAVGALIWDYCLYKYAK